MEPTPPTASLAVAPRLVAVAGTPVRVYMGGHGPALLLLHGGWGGAALHFDRAWELLARHFAVVAPDLPGFEGTPALAPGGLTAQADWLVALLDALGLDEAWVVGNSYGATLAGALAARAPARVRGLVLVGAAPAPMLPRLLRRLLRTRLGRRLVARGFRGNRRVLERATGGGARLASLPSEAIARNAARHAEVLTRAFLDDPAEPPIPAVPMRLVWGRADGLAPHAVVRRLARHLGAPLVWLPDAGHLAQRDAPAAFLDVALGFTRAHAKAPRHTTRNARGRSDTPAAT